MNKAIIIIIYYYVKTNSNAFYICLKLPKNKTGVYPSNKLRRVMLQNQNLPRQTLKPQTATFKLSLVLIICSAGQDKFQVFLSCFLTPALVFFVFCMCANILLFFTLLFFTV